MKSFGLFFRLRWMPGRRCLPPRILSEVGTIVRNHCDRTSRWLHRSCHVSTFFSSSSMNVTRFVPETNTYRCWLIYTKVSCIMVLFALMFIVQSHYFVFRKITKGYFVNLEMDCTRKSIIELFTQNHNWICYYYACHIYKQYNDLFLFVHWVACMFNCFLQLY